MLLHLLVHTFGAGNGSVGAYNFGCVGTENNISGCPFEFSNANAACDHSSDASVVCGQIIGIIVLIFSHSQLTQTPHIANCTCNYASNVCTHFTTSTV